MCLKTLIVFFETFEFFTYCTENFNPLITLKVPPNFQQFMKDIHKKNIFENLKNKIDKMFIEFFYSQNIQ